jgi:predicted O-linked N-acetylglucosamine transferase (SPINDLY family)
MNPQQYLNRLFSYGVEALQKSDLLLAQKTFHQILKEFPGHPDAHNLLGVVLSKKDSHDKAIQHFTSALTKNENNPNYYLNRALAYSKNKEPNRAITDLEKALEINPEFADGYFNLGNIQKQLGKIEEARINFEKTLSLQPQHTQALYNLGNLHLEIGNFKSAITFFERALLVNPNFVLAHNNLGIALQEWDRWTEAETHFKTSLTLDPHFRDAAKNLAALYEKQGRTEEARNHFTHFLKTNTDPWQVLHAEMLCPVIPQSNEEIDSYRKKLNDVLDHYVSQPPAADPDLIHKCGVEPPFMLIYQGRDDKALKQKFASLFTGYFPKNSKRDFPDSGKRKIGFVVTAGHEGVFIKCMKGIIDRLSREKFEVTVICSLPNGEKILRPALGTHRVGFLSIPNQLSQAAQKIDQAGLDILHYWEVGTDSMNYFLPYYRLAPTQCTGWGWPVTSGIPGMDYFISSQNLEAEDGSNHYTEELIKMNRLPVYYHPPSIPQKIFTKSQFGFSDDHTLYLCTQNLRKVHPDFDTLVGDILQQDAKGRVIFIEDKQEHITELFRTRISGANPHLADRIGILKRMNEQDYLGLVGTADVLLDTTHYCGGANTTYDAFAMGTPVITLPGIFHRSRYTAAAYRQTGVFNCISDSPQDYVEKALNLANDEKNRMETSAQLRQSTGRIFEDREAIDELEAFLESH